MWQRSFRSLRNFSTFHRLRFPKLDPYGYELPDEPNKKSGGGGSNKTVWVTTFILGFAAVWYFKYAIDPEELSMKKQIEKPEPVIKTKIATPNTLQHNNNTSTPSTTNDYFTTKINNTTISIVQNDITEEKVDAIVNGTNENLMHGTDIYNQLAYLLVKKDPAIQAFSNDWIKKHGTLQVSQTAMHPTSKLPFPQIIHVLCPSYTGSPFTIEKEKKQLEASVLHVLQQANESKCKSIAFPPLAAGIFGFPKEIAGKIMLSTIEKFCKENPQTTLQQIKIVNADTASAFVFAKLAQQQV